MKRYLYQCWISSPAQFSLMFAPATEHTGRISSWPEVQTAQIHMFQCWGFEGVLVPHRAPQMQGRQALTVPFHQLCELLPHQASCRKGCGLPGSTWGRRPQENSDLYCGFVLFFFNCSQAVNWITWRRFWMTCRTASYRSFSRIAAPERQRARWTSKPSSMTSCSSPVTAAPARPWPPRNQQWGFHRAVSLPSARVLTKLANPQSGGGTPGWVGEEPGSPWSWSWSGLAWWRSAICGRPVSKRVRRLCPNSAPCKSAPSEEF